MDQEQQAGQDPQVNNEFQEQDDWGQEQNQWDEFGWLNANGGNQGEVQAQIPPVVDLGQMGGGQANAANDGVQNQGIQENQQIDMGQGQQNQMQ